MSNAPTHRSPLGNREEAVALVDKLAVSMNELGAVLDLETEEVRNGRLKEAMALAPHKNDASRRYLHLLQAANVNAQTLKGLASEHLTALKDEQAAFNERLQLNLTVLATAQALSGSLVQEIAAAVARSDTPAAYSKSGTSVETKTVNATRPIALNKSL